MAACGLVDQCEHEQRKKDAEGVTKLTNEAKNSKKEVFENEDEEPKTEWVSLADGCGGFGNGLPFCLTSLEVLRELIAKNVAEDDFDNPFKALQPNAQFAKLAAEKMGSLIGFLGKNTCLNGAIECINELGGFDNDHLPPNWNQELWEEILDKLNQKGLKSLPKSSVKTVFTILASLGVVFAIVKKLRPSCLPVCLSNKEKLKKFLSGEVEEVHKEAEETFDSDSLEAAELSAGFMVMLTCLICIVVVNEQNCMLYRTLELGNCWEEAFQRLTDGKALLVL